MGVKQKSIIKLFIPICMETLFYMLSGMIDTLMLSSVNDKAVGAVGTSNTYIGMFIIMFSIISAGMIAVMTQYIGADQAGVAYQARQIGVAFNAVIGLTLSIFLFFYSGKLLVAVGVAPSLLPYAKDYLQIVGSGCILNALIPIFSSYLRAFGKTKQPMFATIFANILNLGLNALFLFEFQMGVKGVAYATVISRTTNLLLVIGLSYFLIHAKSDPSRQPIKKVLQQIVKIGLPSAMETGLYNVAMVLITRFLNQMDPDGINATARSYASQIANFSYCVGAALAQANAIMTGWRIGAKQFDECNRGTRKAAAIGVVIAALIESLFAISASFIMRLFTDDPQMILLVGKLLAIDIVLEVGRVMNLVYGQALKTSGDAIFPTVIAAIFMYLCGVFGTYFFGIHLGYMVVGAYIAMAMDECVRAVGMYLRWKQGKWRTKGLVT